MILGVIKVYCRNCGRYIDDDMIFCPGCGFQVQQIKKICYFCKNPLKDNEEVCPCCGRRQQQPPTQEKDPYQGYWKKPILWIILLVLFAGAILITEYISNNPISIAQTSTKETVELSGEMSYESLFANNQKEGYALKDETSLYCVINKQLYRAPLDQLDQMEVLVDNCQGYLSQYGNKIYYCDIDYDYYSYDLETGETELILENIYYPVVVEGMLYYQLDADNESIHCLNLETKEDKKYNDSTSYDISVDVAHEKIYYLSLIDNQYVIKRIDCQDGSEEDVYKCHDSVSFVLDDDYIYVYDDGQIIQVDKESQKEKVLKDGISATYVNICDDKIVYGSSTSIYLLSKDGKEEEEIYNGFVMGYQVAGDNVILMTYNENYEKCVYVLDTNGRYEELSKQSQIEEIEGLEEV